MIYGGHFDIPTKIEELEKLELQTKELNFWNDRNKAEEVLKEIKELKDVITSVENTKSEISSNKELLQLSEMENDEELYNDIM